jgi:hypothetical protein
VTDPTYSDWDQGARELGLTGVDEMVAAAARQPAGTLLLRSDRFTPAELADEVLARAGLRRFTQTASERGRQDRWTQKKPRLYRTSAKPIRGTSSEPRHGWAVKISRWLA